MRRNTTQTAAAPVTAPKPTPKAKTTAVAKTKISETNSPARHRKAAKPESAQPSLFALDAPPAKPPKAAPVKSASPEIAKTNPPAPKVSAPAPVKAVAKTAKTNPAPKAPAPKVTVKKTTAKAAQPVRVANEPARPETFEGGTVWKMSGKHSVAYVQDAALAVALLATEPKNLPRAAMAVYYDKKGKPFAWQVRFESDRWDEVMRRLA